MGDTTKYCLFLPLRVSKTRPEMAKSSPEVYIESAVRICKNGIQFAFLASCFVGVCMSLACSSVALESQLGACHTTCCGNTTCNCSDQCVPSASDCHPYYNFNAVCRYFSCVSESISTYGCTNSSTYIDTYTAMAAAFQQCEITRLQKSCTLLQFETASLCLKAAQLSSEHTRAVHHRVLCANDRLLRQSRVQLGL